MPSKKVPTFDPGNYLPYDSRDPAFFGIDMQQMIGMDVELRIRDAYATQNRDWPFKFSISEHIKAEMRQILANAKEHPDMKLGTYLVFYDRNDKTKPALGNPGIAKYAKVVINPYQQDISDPAVEAEIKSFRKENPNYDADIAQLKNAVCVIWYDKDGKSLHRSFFNPDVHNPFLTLEKAPGIASDGNLTIS